MDAAGKDGLVSHVMGGVNPQGVDVYSFKQPTPRELLHDYMWRVVPYLPERGKIAIFNRSYYEDVLVVRVHELHRQLNLPERCTDDIFCKRYEQIRHFEKYLWENGIRVVKIFLHLSKEEQKKRLLSRIEDKSKNWKFSLADAKERVFWDDYQTAYEDALNATATFHAPWYVIPADKKPAARLIAGEIILCALKNINPAYPELSARQKEELQECGRQLQTT
jgi:PPK2 family polyphosphate:nucleotide phosphotransferase